MVVLKKILSILPLFLLCSLAPPYKTSSVESFFLSTTYSKFSKKTILWVKQPKDSPQLLEDLLQERYPVTTISANRSELIKAYKTLHPEIVVLPISLKKSFQKILKSSTITTIFYPTSSKETFFPLPLSKKTLRKKQKLLGIDNLPSYESFLIKKAKKAKSGKILFVKDLQRKKQFLSRFTREDLVVMISNKSNNLLLGAGGFLERLKKLSIPHLTDTNVDSIESLLSESTKNIYVFLPYEEDQPFLTKPHKTIQEHLKLAFKNHPDKSFYICLYKVPLLNTWTPYLKTSERYCITLLRGDKSHSTACSDSISTCINHSKSSFFIPDTSRSFHTQLTAYNFTH